MNIRAGKDVALQWTVLTDGQEEPLSGRDLKLYMQTPDGREEEIVKTVMEVWGQICPGWELYCISLPIGDPEERKKIMQYAANEVIKSTRE